VPDPGTFTVLQITVTAVITAAAGLPFALWLLRPTYRAEAVVLAALAGAAVLARRLSANMPRLNNDGVAADEPATGAPRHSSIASSAATPISAHPATTAASLTSARPLTIIRLAVGVSTN